MLWMILVGFAAGGIAKFLVPGKEPGGFIITTLLGIGGSVVGGFLGRFVGIYTESIIGDVISATIGAVIIILIYNKFKNREA